MQPKIIILWLFLLSLGWFACQPKADQGSAAAPQPSRVFLIYVDDLRPELGCYGNGSVHSPHLDALAEDAIVFDQAYANVPVCGASRASMLSGMRPTRQRFMRYNCRVEEDAPEAVTLPGHFKANGYLTLSMGKVFHHGNDKVEAWSELPYHGPKHSNKDYASQENIYIDNHSPRRRAASFEAIDTTDEAYLDGKLAQYAIEKLDEVSGLDTSLFMAVGFYKPHLPFNAPQRYWDLYERDQLPFPTNYYPPQHAPAASLHQFGELRSYTDIPDGTGLLDSAQVRQNIHGYYACISYTDAQIGKFIQALKDRGWYDESLIVLVGDHGWFLGEHTLWSKHANYQNALRTTLMMKLPHSKQKGHSQLPVELVELYPTLMEALELEPPSHLQASSFLPLLDEEKAKAEKEVYCRYLDGETLIKGPYAYTQYLNDAGEVYAQMLYDHRSDPAENHNVVESTEATLVRSLSQQLQAYRNNYGQ